jgi:hypothetical protein
MAKQVGGDLDFQNVNRPINLPQAVAAGQPITYDQFMAAKDGNSWKDNVRVASTGNINLSSPGATIDGVTMSAGDRFLAKDQTTQTQNGIYIWNGAAIASTRTSDADTFLELESAIVQVDEGTTNAGTAWRQTQVNGVIDTNNIVWTTAFSSTPQATETLAGKAEIATQAETDAGTDDLTIVTPKKLKDSPWALNSFKANIGDGSATAFTVTHNFNTRDVMVTIYRNSATYDEPVFEVEHTTVNTITVKASPAIALNAFRVIVIKA